MLARRALAGLTFLSAATLASSALASGISLGKFGGIYGHANADGGLALYWNPALLSVDPGIFATLDASLVHRKARYFRETGTTDPDDIAANTGKGAVNTNGQLPMLAAGYVHDFGGTNFGIAAGVFPSFGGIAEWDRNANADPRFPGAIDGPQRWHVIETRLLILHYTLGLSATFKEIGLSIGATGALVSTTLDTVKARNLNRTDSLVDGAGFIQEGRAHFEGDDLGFVFTAGVAYEADNVRAGFNYRSGFDLEVVGPIRQAYATNAPTTEQGQVDLSLPHVMSSAVTPRFGNFEITLAGEYTVWSVMESNDVFATDTGQQILEIPRDLENALGAKLVPGYHIDDSWLVSALVGYDSSAVPDTTIEAGFMDANKVQYGVGGRYQGDWAKVSVSWHADHFQDLTITNSRVQPTANGRYTDRRDWFNVTLEGRW